MSRNASATPSPLSIAETTNFYTSTNIILATNIHVSNVNNVTYVPQIDNNYIEIHQYAYEKAVSILIFIFILFTITICIYWLIKFKLYQPSLDAHRPLLILFSYMIILPWLFMDSIGAMYLYCHQEDRSSVKGREQWTHTDGTLPIIFSVDTDYALHFLFWFGFWVFIQLKMFKVWIARYKLEYKKHMENFNWKDKFGLKDVQTMSYFLQYQSLWRDERPMLLIQFIFALLLMCLQIAIRLSSKNNPTSPVGEQIFIWIIATIQFAAVVYIGYYIHGTFDEIYFKLQSKQLFILCSFALLVWLMGIIISGAAGTNIDYFWYKSGSLLFWSSWLTALCYFETKWILNQSLEEMKGIQRGLTLSDILKDKEGFETIMRFLMNENECGKLLLYVELSQFITRWTPEEMQTYANPNGMFSTPGGPKYSNYDALSSVDDLQDVIDVFPYFENKELWSEVSHYQYIMNKYVSENATIPVNISDEVRQSTNQQNLCNDAEFLLMRMYQLRAEIWTLLKNAFSKFRSTEEYKKLTKIISPKPYGKRKKKKKKKHQRVSTIEEAVVLQQSTQSHLQITKQYDETWEDEEKMVELPLQSGHDGEDEKAEELRHTEMTTMEPQEENNGYVAEREDIREWLNTVVGFPEYYDNFVLSGYESLDMIKQITEYEKLKAIGIYQTGDAVNVMLEIKRLRETDELDGLNGVTGLESNEDEKNGMEHKDGGRDTDQESDEMRKRGGTNVEDGGMVVVTRGYYSKVDKVEKKDDSVEYVDIDDETPYI